MEDWREMGVRFQILKAEDSQLNEWAPIKRVSEYKDRTDEQRDIVHFERKAKDVQRKKRIFHAA